MPRLKKPHVITRFLQPCSTQVISLHAEACLGCETLGDGMGQPGARPVHHVATWTFQVGQLGQLGQPVGSVVP